MTASKAATASPDPGSEGFFAALPRLARAADTFDPGHYRPAPDDWALVVTDIVGSTKSMDAGRHKIVNFVAASAIAALRNLCAPQQIPFLFGGDGAVVMVPPAFVERARTTLARVRAMAARDFDMTLRVGLVTMTELRRLGGEVQVGRYEPTPRNSFGVFLGGGVGLLEAAIKGRGNAALAALAAVPETLDDGAPADLEGLSCRWDELRSTRGRMVTLIVLGPGDIGAIHAAVLDLAAPGADARPVRVETLRTTWPPAGLLLEARARRRLGPLPVAVLWLLAETLVAKLVFARGKPIGGFDPQRYRHEIASNTDFCKFDDTLCFVVDCAAEQVESIRRYMDDCARRLGIRYGMHVSETALMTCLVSAIEDGLHVHFVDGGAGGYTLAAKGLKAAA